MIDPGLLACIRRRFAIDWNGTHGVRHWGRVRENGLRLAPLTGARTDIVELFAVLHDAQRRDEWQDPDHGPRAATFARRVAKRFLHLEPGALDLLCHACRHHSDGLMSGDITVLTCWDADRLDLGRVGVRPAPAHLCTGAARDPAVIEWAWRRGVDDEMPAEPLETAEVGGGLAGRLLAALGLRRVRGGS